MVLNLSAVVVNRFMLLEDGGEKCSTSTKPGNLWSPIGDTTLVSTYLSGKSSVCFVIVLVRPYFVLNRPCSFVIKNAIKKTLFSPVAGRNRLYDVRTFFF